MYTNIIHKSYYRQLSADIRMKNYKINTSFISPEDPKAQDNKTGNHFMIFIVIFLEICLSMIFQYSLEPVIIQRILIVSEAILEIWLVELVSKKIL